MKWLGLDWDEGPSVQPDGTVKGYRQTERMDIYREQVDRLLKAGKAYYCYCTPEELDARRKEAMAEAVRAPSTTGNAGPFRAGAGRTPAVRFLSSDEGTDDRARPDRGPVTFENQQLDDLIIQRSDGIPTYNFAVVVDDVTMKISHVSAATTI